MHRFKCLTEHVEATAVGACELVRLSPVDESLIIWHVLVFGCLVNVNVSTPKLPPSPTMFWHRYLPSVAKTEPVGKEMLRLKHATQAAMQPVAYNVLASIPAQRSPGKDAEAKACHTSFDAA